MQWGKQWANRQPGQPERYQALKVRPAREF